MSNDPVPWVVSISPSDELKQTLEAIKRKPRCYREPKMCPVGGCDCEQQVRRPDEEPEGR